MAAGVLDRHAAGIQIIQVRPAAWPQAGATALAALPFGLGTVFWFAGEGIGTLVTGVVLGLAISVPAAWFLYRLKENELPYAAAGNAVAATIASVLSIGLYVGIDLGLNQTLIASGSEQDLRRQPVRP